MREFATEQISSNSVLEQAEPVAKPGTQSKKRPETLTSTPALREVGNYAPLKPINRLGTAHRIETLRATGILGRRFDTVVDIGGYDGAICSRINASDRMVVEPHVPEPSLCAANVRFFQSDGASAPLPDSSADLVMLLDVLEHVQEPGELVTEALRLLKPGGTGVITVPSAGIRIFPWFMQDWADRRWDHTIRRGYSATELKTLVHESQGEVVQSLDMGCAGFRLTYLPVSVLWRAWPAAAKKLLAGISRFDYRLRSIGSGRGYIFIEFRRPADG